MSVRRYPLPEAKPSGSHPSDTHQHVVQFYGEVAGLIDGVGNYIGEALEEGNATLVLATAEHREALTKRLQERGVNIPGVMAEGRYVMLDAEETLSKFVLEGWPDPLRFEETVELLVTQV
jgi:hypothetical protein